MFQNITDNVHCVPHLQRVKIIETDLCDQTFNIDVNDCGVKKFSREQHPRYKLQLIRLTPELINSVIAIRPLTAILVSIVVSIPACHAGDRGSIPRRGDQILF